MVYQADFERHFGETADAVFFSPGRVNLIGEHTDYNGGWVLPAAIDLGTYFVLKRRPGSTINIFSQNYAEQIEINLQNLGDRKPENHWADYFVGVIREFSNQTEQCEGMDILVTSTLPVAAGLSSSASITTGFASVLNDLWALSMPPEKLALIAQASENNFVGVACGILDPFSIAMGKQGQLMALNCSTMAMQYVPFPFEKYRIVVVDSGIPRNLTDSEYNLRHEECDRALSLIQQHMNVQTLSDLTMSDLEGITALDRDPIAFCRTNHIVSENARVKSAVTALKTSNMREFGQQLIASHESLRDDFEVSCRELDLLVDESMKLRGVVGSKMTGAGFGGCILSIVRCNAVDEFVARLADRYQTRSGMKAQFYVCSPSPGVRRLPPTH